MKNVKELFESILSGYKEIDPFYTTHRALLKGNMYFGICFKIHTSLVDKDVIKEALDVLGRYTSRNSYYCTPPVHHNEYMILTSIPIGEDLYERCIVPRIILLESILEWVCFAERMSMKP